MSSRGLWVKLGRRSMRSTSVLVLAATLLVVAGATGLKRVAASLVANRASVAPATPARHLNTAVVADNAVNRAKVVGVFEGKFDAKTKQITFLGASEKDVRVSVGKVQLSAFGRSDANTLLPNGTYNFSFTRSCANPDATVPCQSTAPAATVSAELKITNTGTRKFYNTRQIFTDFRNSRGGTPITANAFFNDGQVPANGQLGVSRDYGDIDPNNGSQTRVWSFFFPAGSLTSFYFRYVVYADIGVATESVEPAAVQNDAPRNITITGQAFSSPTVELLNAGGTSVASLSVNSSSATQIVAVVPASTAPGIYSVRVTNAGETAGGPGSSTLIGRLTVTIPPDGGHTGTFSAFSDAGPYRITGNSTISGNVPAGTVVYINDGVTLQVGTGLIADGGIPGVPATSPAQIVFTSAPSGSAWGGINATSATGDVTLRNCVVEFGGNSGAGQVDISGSTRTLRFTDSISRRSAGHGIKATGVDDKFTGFTRSRVENNVGTAVLLSANAALGSGAGMADVNAVNANTQVPDQGYYYSAANVIRGNGVNAIQVDAATNDFTKSGVLVGQGDIPIQLLGSGANPSTVGNAGPAPGAELNINPNAIIQLAAGMDLKAGDGTLFGNIAANGYAGTSHSSPGNNPDPVIVQRIVFDKIPGGGNFGALYFSPKSAGSSILNFVSVQNGGSSGSGQAQVVVDNITYSFKFTNSQSTNSSSYGLQYRSDNTVDRSGTTYSGNTTGNENVISGAVTLSSIVGGTFGDGLQGNQATLRKPVAIAVDPGRGVYFVDTTDSTPLIRFLNTTNAPVKIAGVDIPANAVRKITPGGQKSPLTLANNPIDELDFVAIRGIALSEDQKVLYVCSILSGGAYVHAINVSPGVALGAGPVTITGTSVPTGNVRTIFDNDSVATSIKLSTSDTTAKALAVSPTNGDIYVADADGFKVLKITKAGVASVFAGTGNRPRPFSWSAFSAGSATGTVLAEPTAVVVSTDGNTVYVADSAYGRAVRIQSGNMQLVTQLGDFDSGNLVINPNPSGVAVLGNSLYISNRMTHTIVKVDNPATVVATASPSGIGPINTPPVILVAGTTGTSCDYIGSNVCGDGGAASGAGFNFGNMNGNIQCDGTGLFIADQLTLDRGRIRYLNPSGGAVTRANVNIAAGNIHTVAGAGLAAPFDGGLAAAASFASNPTGVTVDANNNLWIAEGNINGGSRLRFVNRGNAALTIAGQAVAPGAIITVNKDAATFATEESTSPNDSYFYTLQGLTATSEGVYVVDSVGKAVGSNPNLKKTSRLRFINTSAASVTFYAGAGTPIAIAPGEIKTIAGGSTDPSSIGDGGFATSAKLFGTTDVAIHPSSGDIYLSESANKKVRKINRNTGIISSLGITDNQFTGLAFDATGRLHIAVYNTNQVLRETASGSGSFSSVASAIAIKGPRDIAVDSTGSIYVMNGDTIVSNILKIPTAGAASVFVGTSAGVPGFGGDGGAPDAATVKVDFGLGSVNVASTTAPIDLIQTSGIVVTPSGEVVFTDAANNRIRRVR